MLCTLASLCMPTAWADDPEDLRERAAAIHRRAIVMDGHNDVPVMLLDYGFDLGMDGNQASDRKVWLYWMLPWMPGAPTGEELRTDTDFARVQSGGLDAQFFSIWVSPEYYDADDPVPGVAIARANALIDVVQEQARRHPDRMEMATSVADVRRIAAAGKLAALLGVEGGHAIEDSLDTLRRFHERGVRYMTLTWSFSHHWADSSGETR